MALNLYPSSRPRSIGEILDTAFHIFKLTWLKGLPYGVLAMLASQTQSIYYVLTRQPLRQFGGGDPRWWVFFILGTCGTLWMGSALLLRQASLLEGKSSSFGAELRITLRRLPSLIAAVVVNIAAVFLGLVVAVVPGLYLLVGLSLTAPAIMLSAKGAIGGPGYSLELVRGHWLRSFGVYAVGFSALLVFGLLAFLLVAVLLPFAGAGDVAVVTAFSQVLGVILGAAAAPFISALIIALYADLEEKLTKKRQEEEARTQRQEMPAGDPVSPG
ncbi:MAG TPA: hypothetical protein VGM84_08705 [Steroidobacteraceae bacterium]|jgi:hypothetical protein